MWWDDWQLSCSNSSDVSKVVLRRGGLGWVSQWPLLLNWLGVLQDISQLCWSLNVLLMKLVYIYIYYIKKFFWKWKQFSSCHYWAVWRVVVPLGLVCITACALGCRFCDWIAALTFGKTSAVSSGHTSLLWGWEEKAASNYSCCEWWRRMRLKRHRTSPSPRGNEIHVHVWSCRAVSSSLILGSVR